MAGRVVERPGSSFSVVKPKSTQIALDRVGAGAIGGVQGLLDLQEYEFALG